jgi:hypothetical protein
MSRIFWDPFPIFGKEPNFSLDFQWGLWIDSQNAITFYSFKWLRIPAENKKRKGGAKRGEIGINPNISRPE